MYEKTATDGIVLRKRGVGEANLRVAILTREFGLVVASARAARAEASKLRYGLEPLTSARFCLIRGRHEWRVTEAHGIRPLGLSAQSGRIAQLLLRLVHGEEKNPQLFDEVSEGLRALAATKEPHAEAIECVLVLRILFALGYLPHTQALAPFIEGGFSIELSAKAIESRSLLVRTINESLQMTGL
ncbi:hypothetical protein A2852_00785 [Candidatus Adlerbacteria bacterium RIFCSPHIGHO2_01_FULL_54_23]|uniref:DNA replication/recombination mediator RecO N-terminal domain-containing protein n=3 Tax=Candidatus Adleribacteriota TaxID=1752736 RepID=A0A1F4Y034_9BACT|nr:MAG: repair protein RecO protein [Candidatus Adlerbacteria bacterium GW2011_GWA1_54_10]KKW36302.1 MAG: repair protein RecO protein [Candidatus Adlerbacteria bacterium GW2011_GWA2_54_12]KKW37832.1 MAG: repair protein RecO protein [Candidatus Adlerbacteria bacterium GW2011_GWB1_54_7]OGC78863.1 MAG: hypothetical protein A2852_00785 [Candidatus Adlerbacteria bacterium RIFCSPHIGHO2_01_FULL_54_23]OGC87241.1 MAG: hypothetical protein A3B33_02710 [Candidatus Adlerbacteria bacterium RIFCSPLOWO2_01_FU